MYPWISILDRVCCIQHHFNPSRHICVEREPQRKAYFQPLHPFVLPLKMCEPWGNLQCSEAALVKAARQPNKAACSAISSYRSISIGKSATLSVICVSRRPEGKL